MNYRMSSAAIVTFLAAFVSGRGIPAFAQPPAQRLPLTPPLEVAPQHGWNVLSATAIEEGWIKLFDGHTLFGWTNATNTPWKISNGVLQADEGPEGILMTKSRFANYEFRCEYKLAAGGNSGVFLRSAAIPKNPAVDCYELNFCDTHPAYKTASLVGRQQPESPVRGDGDWHRVFVRVEGTTTTVQFDDQQVTRYVDTSPKPLTIGHIGLQYREGAISFRNVFVRPLTSPALFDGSSLDGWSPVPGNQADFAVKDGSIQIHGKGFLQSRTTAGDFVLQFQARTEPNVNSGLFFRSMNGTDKNPSNGYEFQIHCGYLMDDRNQPADGGAGAIFRRQNARRVVASDREWMTCSLIADGLHLSTWVNGIQVVDVVDDRKPDENPRRGSRTTAGHFILQGHDADTKVSFRGFRLQSLPE